MDTTTPKKRRTPHVSRTIYGFLTSHPGTEFSVDAIARQTNLTYLQVQQSMSRMEHRGWARRGSVSGYWASGNAGTQLSLNGSDPAPAGTVKVNDVLEVLRVNPETGNLLVVDENGAIYRATRLDV